MAPTSDMTVSARRKILMEDFERLFSAQIPWERLEGRSVLVTGATGLVASYLVEALLFLNENVARPGTITALVRNAGRAHTRFASYARRGDLQFIVQDVSVPLPSHVKTNFIVHAAGNATPRSFSADPVGTYESAVIGSHNLLKHAHRHGCEAFLLLSSGAVHGSVSGENTIIREDVMGVVDPLDPYACYAESKRMAETICASWTRQHALRTRIVRLGHTYGPGISRGDDRAFAQFLYAAVDSRDITLNSDGAAVRPYCYLSDAADAIFRVMLSGANGEAYLVVNPYASCSVRELANLISKLASENGVHVRANKARDFGSVSNRDPYHKSDISKMRSLGWQPRISLEDGLRRTFEALR